MRYLTRSSPASGRHFAVTSILFVVLCALALLIVFFLPACSKKQPESKEIRIGVISPFTGEGANYGKAARTAIDMAVDEINAQGGINGAKLVIIYEDDKGNLAMLYLPSTSLLR